MDEKPIRLRTFIRPHRVKWVLSILFGLVGMALYQYLMAVGIENIANGMNQQNYDFMVVGFRLFFYSLLVVIVCSTFDILFGKISIAGIMMDLKNAVFLKLLTLPLKTDQFKHSAAGMTILNQDVDLALEAISDSLKKLIINGIFVLFSITMIFLHDMLLGVLSVVMVALNIGTGLFFGFKQGVVVRERQNSLEKMSGVYSDAFSGSMVIKLFSLHDLIKKRIMEAADGVYASKQKERRWVLLQNACAELFYKIFNRSPLLLTIYLCAIGRIQVGDMFFISQLGTNMMFVAGDLSKMIIMISKSSMVRRRLMDLLNETEEARNFGKETVGNQCEDVLVFQDLQVSYGDKSIIQNFNFKIKKNETVAFVGTSGAGKSSFMKSILQLIPFKGEMMVFGKRVTNYSLEFLRKSIAYVEQESKLFDGTIYENIAYGRIGATMEEVQNAAKHAYIDEFIRSLPNGYDTVIGENGYKVSGGECQRIAIARAFLRNAPILLLDEATSALDAESEHMVQKAVEGLMQGRTILVIAHRLKTIQKANRIVVMEKGGIVEIGNHQELMSGNGRYRQLYEGSK